MKKGLSWLIFSLPTLLGYTLTSMGFNRTAKVIYEIICKYNYPPALFQLGALYCFAEASFLNVEHGKKLIEHASHLGYQPATEWLKKYNCITQEGMEAVIKIDTMTSSSSSRLYARVRPYIYLGLSAFLIYMIIKK